MPPCSWANGYCYVVNRTGVLVNSEIGTLPVVSPPLVRRSPIPPRPRVSQAVFCQRVEHWIAGVACGQANWTPARGHIRCNAPTRSSLTRTRA